MKFYLTLLLIIFIASVGCASVASARKEVDPNISALQPIPVNVTPNVSGNINSTDNGQTPVLENELTGDSDTENQNSPSGFFNNLPDSKNYAFVLYFLAIITLSVIAFLIFLYFKK